MDGYTNENVNDRHDERTPLLEQQSPKQTKTPLDKLQLGIILLGTIVEPICSQSIYPFINEVCLSLTMKAAVLTNLLALQLVSTLDIIGGDETKVGYYAGMIVSALSESATGAGHNNGA